MLTKWKSSLLTLTTVAFLGLAATSCGENEGVNIDIAGVKGPHITLTQDVMVITSVFENLQMDGGLRYTIPKYNYSYVEISPDLQSNGTLMQVSVSLKDIIDGNLETLPPAKLPGGRDLPGIAGGKLPAVAFSIEKFHNMSLYVSKDVFGVFLPADVGVEGAIASFRYYISGTKAGTISLVGKDQNGENSGILLLLNMDGKIKKQLHSVYKKYNF